MISFLTIAFEQGKEHPNHGCLHSQVQLHRGLHKPSSPGLLAFQCPQPISFYSLILLNHYSPQTASCSARNQVGNLTLGKQSEVETVAHCCPPEILRTEMLLLKSLLWPQQTHTEIPRETHTLRAHTYTQILDQNICILWKDVVFAKPLSVWHLLQ